MRALLAKFNLCVAASAMAVTPLLAAPASVEAIPVSAAAPGERLGQTDAEAASTSLASPAASPLTQEQLVGALERDIAAHFNLEGELKLELLRAWSGPDRVAREWQVQVAEYPTLPTSSMLVRCRVLADGAAVAEPTFVLRAALWRDAWIARQPVTNGGAFDPSLLDTRRVDAFRERDALPAAVGDRSFVFTRSVQAGRLLTWRDVARRPLVRKGDLVEVSAAEGALVITMKGLAMQNGAQGEAVTIRNPESKKDFTAFVVDENRVQVRF
ncbi:MAG: flagellar basal body P-ring formation protein FlgA [Opitutae bacterium]|nr:flagellar basal body P-ring formation protein FlgA [Opitutae bacterium]